MVIRIFYLVIAIFSVSMVFLASSSPYYADDIKQNFDISTIQIKDVVDYEMNATKVFSKYKSTELNRYKNKDVFLNFSSTFLKSNLKHNVSSKKAISNKDKLILLDNVVYDNNNSFKFTSNEVVYDKNRKDITSNKDFILINGSNKVKGNSITYDTVLKKINAKRISAWIEDSL